MVEAGRSLAMAVAAVDVVVWSSDRTWLLDCDCSGFHLNALQVEDCTMSGVWLKGLAHCQAVPSGT